MKLTIKQLNDFQQGLQTYIENNPAQRYGQATFNYLYELYPEIANLIRGKQEDPFYDDNKLSAFYQWLEDEVLIKQ